MTEQEVKIELIDGYVINPNKRVVEAIIKRCKKLKGECPCHHDEWTEETPMEDKICPCITYRSGKGCHCGLYVKRKQLSK